MDVLLAEQNITPKRKYVFLQKNVNQEIFTWSKKENKGASTRPLSVVSD
jgi:hypothetical protein